MKTRSKTNRTGAATVEAALMLPLLIITTFGAIDVAQYINAAQVISNSSREGGRAASHHDTTETDQVEQAVKSYLAEIYPHLSAEELASAVSISVRKGGSQSETIPGGNLSSLVSGETIEVVVDFDFSAVRWVKGPLYGQLTIANYSCRE